MLLKVIVPARCISLFLSKPLSTQAGTVKVNPLSPLESAVWTNAKSYKEIPGPTKYELIRGFLPGGEYHNKSLTDFLLKSRARYGEIYRLPGLFGKSDMVLTFNVEDFEKVFRTEGIWPTRPGLDSLKYYKYKYQSELYKKADGLLNSHGKEWGQFRTTVNPVLMKPQNAKTYVTPIQKVNSEWLQRIRDIRDPDTNEMPATFIDEINRLTFESIAVVALNKHLGLILENRERADAKKLFASLQVFLQLLYDLDIQPSMWKYVWTPSFARYKKALDLIYCTITQYINEAIERFESEKRSNIDDTELSVLEKLIKIDKSIAIVMAVELLIAGVDTTSSIMSGILLEVAKHPEKQATLREEVRQFLPEKDSTFTVDSMKNLPYLRACIKEGIRLHPIVPGIPRVAGEDITLRGYQIPKNTQVLLNINLSLREERFFRRPNEFIPERWIRDGPLEQEIQPFSYIPFGFGPRMCVGKRIVDLELEVTLARLVRNFYMEFNYPIDNAFKSHFINTPAIPLKFKFTELEN